MFDQLNRLARYRDSDRRPLHKFQSRDDHLDRFIGRNHPKKNTDGITVESVDRYMRSSHFEDVRDE